MTYNEMTDEQLISEYRGLYQAIYEIECYGSHDIMNLDNLASELMSRGYTITMKPEIYKEEEDEEEEEFVEVVEDETKTIW